MLAWSLANRASRAATSASVGLVEEMAGETAGGVGHDRNVVVRGVERRVVPVVDVRRRVAVEEHEPGADRGVGGPAGRPRVAVRRAQHRREGLGLCDVPGGVQVAQVVAVLLVGPVVVEGVLHLHGAGDDLEEELALEGVAGGPGVGLGGRVQGAVGAAQQVGRLVDAAAELLADQRVELVRAEPGVVVEADLHLDLEDDRRVVGVELVPGRDVVEAAAEVLVAAGAVQLARGLRGLAVVVVAPRVAVAHPPALGDAVRVDVDLEQRGARVQRLCEVGVLGLVVRVVRADRCRPGELRRRRVGVARPRHQQSGGPHECRQSSHRTHSSTPLCCRRVDGSVGVIGYCAVAPGGTSATLERRGAALRWRLDC